MVWNSYEVLLHVLEELSVMVTTEIVGRQLQIF